ncbi:MAG: A24 family peptidase [Chloroflexota bacterium]
MSLLFAAIGLAAGGLINGLADDLPRRARPQRPHCPRCGYVYGLAGWLALTRSLAYVGSCPQCGLPTRRRALVVEVGTAVLFAILPLLLLEPANLIVYALYIAVLILVIVIDLEHRLILRVVVFPATVVALAGSLLVSDNSPLAAVLGATMGYAFFYFLYWLGRRLRGPGALGYGDVTLAMTLGAMLGVHRVFFAFVLAIGLAALVALFLLVSRRATLRDHFAYGPYLAVAGMVMLIWGGRVLEWYQN